MIPSILSNEIKRTVLDYLDTTFSFQDDTLAESLKVFLLNSEQGMFKGPYVSVRLPFRKAEEGERNLTIFPPFTPYVHQIKSFERLSSKNRQPKPTLVTTGTGSGKTECFTYPILDYCYHQRDIKGIKAIILYPMNALASDQAKRLAEMIHDDEEHLGHIRVGMYVGGKGTYKQMGSDHVIDDRETLRKDPPDILLTNYKMLDYLLIRPEDKSLWQNNDENTLQYLVLDELHTYDGAQGSDVANLIRRLKARLRIQEGNVAMVGTSATIASEDEDSIKTLIDFASTIFGETFESDSVILEDRIDLSDFLDQDFQYYSLPKDSDKLTHYIGESQDHFIRSQMKVWFESDQMDAVELGKALKKHSFLGALLDAFQNEIVELEILKEKLAKRDQEFAGKSNERQEEIIHSFITLVSAARLLDGKRKIPFLQVQVQIWIREIRRLLRKVSTKPEFYWKDGIKPLDKVGLPMYYCRECGHSGWLTYPIDGNGPLQIDTTLIYNRFFDHNRYLRYIYLDDGEEVYINDQQQMAERVFLNPKDLSIYYDQNKEETLVPVIIREAKVTNTKPPKDRHCCPKCDADDSIVIAGSQAASLASVAISHLYTSPFNEDKKLLVFTDSVQDASHRASFFENRTYRFNFRTALQTAVESINGPMTLTQLPAYFYDFWISRFQNDEQIKNPIQHFVATFMPPDLKEEPEYKRFIKNKTEIIPNELMALLSKRISWEITMEYGFSARIGRTLDKVKSSIIYPDPTKINHVTEKFVTFLSGDYGVIDDLGEEKVKQFILGLLMRIKLRGGIDHQLLYKYRNDQGNTFMLTKKMNPHISPMGGAIPHFLTDDKNSKNLDSFISGGNRNSWAIDWMGRSLSPKLSIQDMNQIYRQFIDFAVDAGIVDKFSRGNIANYGIRPEILFVTTQTRGVICNKCGYRLTVSDDTHSHWVGATCRRYLCRGHYVIDEQDRQAFYRALYSKGHIQRIFSEEHTGLLERTKREEVERLFKAPTGETYADAPNLLTCTPTLEMGIDVGDLSVTMLNSVPPATANYVQRVGRAGRKTGNALIITMSKAQKHDLYFFEQPLAMMAGHVSPPGSYLDAPEILKRHFFAFCMDTWARDDYQAKNLPNKVQLMLNQYKKGEFPNTFIKFYEKQKSYLFEIFTGLYKGTLSESNKEMLQKYIEQNELESSITHVLAKTEKELEKLKKLSASIRTEMKKLENNKLLIDNYDLKIKELENERKLVFRMMNNVKEEYPLELFTNEGLLPNYAFPESGIKLKAIIKRRRLKEDEDPYEVFEVLRPARSALREFAPYNTFYASKRKILIDQVDTGGDKNQKMEEWKFCNNCSHMERITESHYKTACPVCGSTVWEDKGQNRQMLKLEYFQAKTDEISSSTSDEGDEREAIRYHIQHFFDIKKDQWGKAFVIDEIPFGFEYLTEVKLREINFGFQQNLGQNDTMEIAGEEVSRKGFRVCKDCGIVEKPHFIENHQQPHHRYNCKYSQKNQNEKDAWSDVVLYREITSEAIRILIPVSTIQQSDKLYTFKACLELGLRKWYRGNPGHLVVRDHFEPVQGEEHGSRHFLVIYDEVPGGTGYLKNLVETNTFMEVIQKAYEALVICDCEDGCYKCLYAYQNQFEIDIISKNQGIKLLKQILDLQDKLKPTTTLSDVTIESLVESELEERFLEKFKSYVHSLGINNNWNQTIFQGKQCYEFSFDGNKWWRLVPQVELNREEGVLIPSKPDFVFYPIHQKVEVRPIAVFTDGFKYHVKPDERRGEVGDDIRKRMAIRDSEAFWVWTLTWDDVDEFIKEGHVSSSKLLSSEESKQVLQLNTLLKNPLHNDKKPLWNMNKVDQLISLLISPDSKHWEKYAFSILFSWRQKHPQISEEYGLEKIKEIASVDIKPSLEIPDNAPGGNYLYIPQNKMSENENVKGFFLMSLQFLQSFMQSLKIESITVNFKEIEGIIRIEDDYTNRNTEDFKRIWNEFWRLSNLLQFLPNVFQVSRELIEEYGEDVIIPSPVDSDVLSEEWHEILEIVDESCGGILHEIMVKHVPIPEVGYEVSTTQGTVGELELAWETQKVGILLEEDEKVMDILKEQDWKLFLVEELELNLSSLLSSLNIN